MTVDDYINAFPEDTQACLKQIRTLIKEVAPDSTEFISYGMPAYKVRGKPLVYFAGYRRHIGLYAVRTGNAGLINELSAYKQGKGSVQFPLDKPLPVSIITKILRLRLSEIAR